MWFWIRVPCSLHNSGKQWVLGTTAYLISDYHCKVNNQAKRMDQKLDSCLRQLHFRWIITHLQVWLHAKFLLHLDLVHFKPSGNHLNLMAFSRLVALGYGHFSFYRSRVEYTYGHRQGTPLDERPFPCFPYVSICRFNTLLGSALKVFWHLPVLSALHQEPSFSQPSH